MTAKLNRGTRIENSLPTDVDLLYTHPHTMLGYRGEEIDRALGSQTAATYLGEPIPSFIALELVPTHPPTTHPFALTLVRSSHKHNTPLHNPARFRAAASGYIEGGGGGQCSYIFASI